MRARLLLTALAGAIVSMLRLSAATLTAQVDPAETHVDEEVTVTYTVQDGSTGKVQFPTVEGLQVEPGSTITSLSFSSGTLSRSVSQSFRVRAMHSGNFTIPAFDITTDGGEVLHGKALKLHILAEGEAPSNPPPAPTPASPNAVRGPVVMPPTDSAVPDTKDLYASVPKDPDGGPAKVFMTVTPETTDAYVGQSIPIHIDFFIREESNADQNSLPTIKGSDFLMNDFSVRGGTDNSEIIGNILYRRDTWRSAISAPKSGDFPLSVERDTYWTKSTAPTTNLDPFSGFFNRHQNLAHEMITSNQITMHVRPLPEEGKPEHFTGAIGQFQVTGQAEPASVAVGEPLRLHFSVSGVGNFDYVRCPALHDDPAWKIYVPSSKTNYLDEARTHAFKTFEQSLVALQNGTVPLPEASFSYFDPAAKQYVTTPIPLPAITVTGSVAPSEAAAPEAPADAALASGAVPPNPDEMAPNRAEMGKVFATLAPVYRQSWFWQVQAGLLGLALLGALFVALRPRSHLDSAGIERARLTAGIQKEQQAMAEAVQRNDPLAFFAAARHAVQLQLGSQWSVAPEALTLGEIRQRDPHLAETLAPLFRQADEVIYSGRAAASIDLAAWDKSVRGILQPQIVTP